MNLVAKIDGKSPKASVSNLSYYKLTLTPDFDHLILGANNN